MNRKVIRRPFKGVATRWNSDHEEVKSTNIFMGDMQKSLAIMLGEKGCDVKLLRTPSGETVPKAALQFSSFDRMILRQYECASEPVVLLSKFFQLDVPTSHLVLVHLRARIAQIREPKFAMFADISHSYLEKLSDRKKTEMVVSDEVTDHGEGGPVESMQVSVANFRTIFADDLEIRCGLTRLDGNDEEVVHDVDAIPSDMAVACLLNPLVGGKSSVAETHAALFQLTLFSIQISLQVKND